MMEKKLLQFVFGWRRDGGGEGRERKTTKAPFNYRRHDSDVAPEKKLQND
jgi:hypothetical protein